MKLYARAQTGSTAPRRQFDERRLTARAFTRARPSAPTCDTLAVTRSTLAEGLVGRRVRVRVSQLLTYRDPAKAYTGSLQPPQSFAVRRLSPTGTYAYGFAYGDVNAFAWARTGELLPE